MKRTALLLAAITLAFCAYAQSATNSVEISSLTLIGKILDTPNPYHRVDTVKYKGFTKSENEQVRCPAGMAVLFETDSRCISVDAEFGYQYKGPNTMPLAYRGYDLYILEEDGWNWAGTKAAPGANSKSTVVIVADMDGSTHKCMLYLPIYTELLSAKIVVDEGASIKAMESPFRHRIAFFGSSYTHGISTTRAGMSYPMQFMRRTGLQVLGLGVSGNCKMQPYFADVLADVEAEAFVFDSFSNPKADMIEERLENFIIRMKEAHPGIPLVFQQTIYRENRAYNKKSDKEEQAKVDMAEKLMAEMMQKYSDVYFIHPNPSSPDREFSADGIHPDDYGYLLWERSIEQPLLDILAKYNIK